jgi:hypothetical protein
VGDGPKEKKDLAVATVGKDRIYVIGPDINNTKLETYVLDTGKPLHIASPSSSSLMTHARARVDVVRVCVCAERLEWSLVRTKGDKPVNPRAGFSLTPIGDKLVFLGYDMSLNDKVMEIYVLDTGTYHGPIASTC